MTEGRVASINVSGGGVPKAVRQSAWVAAEGIEGDGQQYLRIHGGPDRAVSVYSLELIHRLQAEGHPISPGSTGENLTLAGIDWRLMVPGARIEIADVLLELTSYTTPCKSISDSFMDGEFMRVSQKEHPGWSRLYARVLEPGTITIGSRVLLHSRHTEDPAP
jgi:MOSC domain-containing protein YiiM